jgi:hypothetical protein
MGIISNVARKYFCFLFIISETGDPSFAWNTHNSQQTALAFAAIGQDKF